MVYFPWLFVFSLTSSWCQHFSSCSAMAAGDKPNLHTHDKFPGSSYYAGGEGGVPEIILLIIGDQLPNKSSFGTEKLGWGWMPYPNLKWQNKYKLCSVKVHTYILRFLTCTGFVSRSFMSMKSYLWTTTTKNWSKKVQPNWSNWIKITWCLLHSYIFKIKPTSSTKLI